MGTIEIRDVLPRDGFQDLPDHVPAEVKVAVIEELYDAGLRWIEVSSMVHPRWVPQFTDAEQVVAAVSGLDGLITSVFVPNMRGLGRALDAGAREVSLAVASTDALSRENFAMSRADAVTEILSVAATAREAGLRVSVTIGGAFGCPFEGPVAPDTVLGLIDEFVAAGAVDSVFVADTIGVAVAGDVGRLVGQAVDHVGDLPVGVHLHGGEGAVDRVIEGVRAGATLVDAAMTGLGGCPFVPDAPGNVGTELTAGALNAAGFTTGLDPAAVTRAGIAVGGLLAAPRGKRVAAGR